MTLIEQPVRRPAAAWVLPLGAAVVALLLGSLSPAVGPLLIALMLGAGLVNLTPLGRSASATHAAATRTLLRLGVVLLGLKLPVQDVVRIGWRGAMIIGLTVVITYAATRRLGGRLGLDPELVTLMAAGFSICGAAAIAAVSDVIRARERHVALAVAMVTLFGGLMIGFVPWAAATLGLSDTEAALWAGASIHEVAQVAAAASLIGGPAVALAMLIKLGRVACLAPVTALAGRGCGRPGTPLLPWFIAGFAAAALLRSVVLLPAGVLDVTAWLTTLLLAAGMFGLGLGLRLRDLWPLPWRLLALATASTAVALSTSLALILALG